MRPLSTTVGRIETSATTRFTAMLAELRGKGRDIIDLAVGEFAAPTPEAILRATCQALADGRTRYGPVTGEPLLKEALARKLGCRSTEAVLITNGAKQALYETFRAVCNPGDEVIIPRPCWVSFPQQVRLAGATPVLVDTQRHQLDVAAIEKAVTPATGAIVLNSPNNPTGAVYPRQSLEAVGALAAAHDLWVIGDETYADLVFDGKTATRVRDIDSLRERSVTIGSFSKTYSMTGFRVGYLLAGRDVIDGVSRIHSHVSGNVCTFAQYGALAALATDDHVLNQRIRHLQTNRDLAIAALTKQMDCITPGGAFYLFPDVTAHLAPGETAESLCARLMADAGVAVVPGDAFAMPGHIRLSFAVETEALISGIDRLTGAL